MKRAGVSLGMAVDPPHCEQAVFVSGGRAVDALLSALRLDAFLLGVKT
jgi:hypothetical protein